MKLFVLALFALVLCTAGESRSQDVNTALAKTYTEVPDGADVLSMGNANTSLPSDYSTRNPGAVDATDYPESKFGAATTYANIGFKNGPSVNLYSVSAITRFPIGTLQVTYKNGGSSTGMIDEFGDTLKLDRLPSIDMQCGLRVGSNLLWTDELYAGLGYSYAEYKLLGRAYDSQLNLVDVSSLQHSHTLESGVLYRIAKKVNIGAVYLHSWDATDASQDGVTQTTRSETDQLRLGISAKVTSRTLISADYRHLYLPNGEHDDQYFFGIEQYVVKDVFALYGGWANGGVTTGFGVYSKHCGVNFGYMHRPFRAAEEIFGKADVIMASLYAIF